MWSVAAAWVDYNNDGLLDATSLGAALCSGLIALG
jgi:hypothetical protein